MKSLHHSFDIDLAEEYGIHEAILIHHFQHWIRINQKLKRNFKEGRTWTYQTLDEIAAHFPYLSKSEIYEIIERLCSGKGRRSKKEQEFEPVILKGNFNKTKFDKTTWYSFVNEKMFTVLAQAKMDGGSSQNGHQPEPTPIPDTKTYTKKQQTGFRKKVLVKPVKKVSVVSFLKGLDPFDIKNPIWKKDEDLRDKVRCYISQKLKSNPIPKMKGYIVACIKKGWHLEYEIGYVDPSPIKRVLDAQEGIQTKKTTPRKPKEEKVDFKAIKEGFRKDREKLKIDPEWKLSDHSIIFNLLQPFGVEVVSKAIDEIKQSDTIGDYGPRLGLKCQELQNMR